MRKNIYLQLNELKIQKENSYILQKYPRVTKSTSLFKFYDETKWSQQIERMTRTEKDQDTPNYCDKWNQQCLVFNKIVLVLWYIP